MNNSNQQQVPYWFWLSNPDPYNYDVPKWDAYPKEVSDLIQNNYQNKLMIFPIDAAFSIDLIEMIQFRTFEPDRCRPIKCDIVTDIPDVENPYECITCNNAGRDVILAPCGHTVYCNHCFERLCQIYPDNQRFCPICRKLVESHIKKKSA